MVFLPPPCLARRAAMTTGSPGSGTAFVQGLAARMGATAVIYVRASRAGCVPIVTAEAEQIAGLERVGRSWLAAHHEESVAGADGSHGSTGAAPPSGNGPLLVPISSAAFDVLGVVVAVKHAGSAWSEQERELFQFCVQAHSGDLDKQAISRPIPTPASKRGPTSSQPNDDGQPELAPQLRAAVRNEELNLVFQPEVDLVTRRVIATEALVRWQHPLLGELGPESFISIAERSDLIRLVGDWVIDTAIGTLAAWRAALPGLELTMRVNVSPAQLAGDGVVAPISEALKRHGVPGSQVCIELTEHEPPRDLGEVADALRRLTALGVTSAIDDLATGYSTLSQLRFLSVDMIKIDRSLVAGIDTDARARAIVTAMMGLALNFGLDVIAEGVQSEEEVATLLALGCTRGQGHFLGRPRSAAAIVTLLEDDRPAPAKLK